MITSVFKKSKPLNLVLVLFLVVASFFFYQIQDLTWTKSLIIASKKIGLLLVLLGTIFLTDFITKKNGLSKDSSYTILFYALFTLFFPSIFDNFNIVLANFFILLAIRRLVSLQSLVVPKEKIFDASLWIFIASLFHFWSILYLILVFIAIVFHVARDYRNWVLPFIAFFTIATVALVGITLLDLNPVQLVQNQTTINLKLDYFTTNAQNAAFSIYATIALFFLTSMLFSLSNKPLLLQASYKKIIYSFFIGILVFVLSDHKSNDVLLFTVAPLTVMATSHIEVKQDWIRQEIVLGVLLLCSLILFGIQL